jgi:anti-sigma factor RsiW
MKTSSAQKMSCKIDGELPEAEGARLDREIAGHPDAARTAATWVTMGELLRHEAAHTATPDPLLAWHDIRRAIRQQEVVQEKAWHRSLYHRLRWAGGLAALAVLGVIGWGSFRLIEQRGEFIARPVDFPASRVEWVVAEIPGATTIIFNDVETDMTVIWMDLAQNHDPRDT